MDDFLKRVYIGEIKKQCEFALAAIGNLNHALHQISATDVMPDKRQYFYSEVFRQIHSFLTHASNVSRMFWPAIPIQRKNESNENYENRLLGIDRVIRAEHLKGEYQINDQNSLKDRRLRDHLEHYDERLDDWRNTSVNRNIVSDTIGPVGAIVGIPESDMMRWFDPTRNMFKFRDEEYNLQQIATAINQLLSQSVHLEENLWNRQRNRGSMGLD